MSKLTEAEREIVSALIESKAVDFEAVGSALARYGPSAVLNLARASWGANRSRAVLGTYDGTTGGIRSLSSFAHGRR